MNFLQESRKLCKLFIKSWNISHSLKFQIKKDKAQLSDYFPGEDFEQECLYIVPSCKILKRLPKNCNPAWTLEEYQKEVIGGIDLEVFSCVVFWSEDGIVILNCKDKSQAFYCTWEMYKLICSTK